MKAKLTVNPHYTVARPDRMLFGSFIEHIGRAVYSGIYEPGHPEADEYGFRKDVAALIKDIGVTGIRYPGGNFVSGYNWEDGIGDRASRPRMTDLAWKSIETNEVGTDEFLSYCRRIGCEPIMAVNLGTGGIKEARAIVEYCNLPGGTKYSDLRRKNGYPEPHGVKYWCLGNEMDGEWQIGHKTAAEYGRLAHETAKTMRLVDSDIKLVACGSSSGVARTFPMWENTVLDECYGQVDYISMHQYFSNACRDTASFIASGCVIDRYINEVISACDYVKAKKRSNKTMMLSFDEYNVWYHSRGEKYERFTVAPPILEDRYNVEDAVCVGGILISLLRHCDRVKIGCLAQLVNVIAPIMTVREGGVWKQTIYYPFRSFAGLKDSTVLHTLCESDTCSCAKFGEIPALDSVTALRDDGTAVIFAVNRSTDQPLELDLSLEFCGYGKASHTAIYGDPEEGNSPEKPDCVTEMFVSDNPVCDGRARITLKPLSWNVIELS